MYHTVYTSTSLCVCRGWRAAKYARINRNVNFEPKTHTKNHSTLLTAFGKNGRDFTGVVSVLFLAVLCCFQELLVLVIL